MSPRILLESSTNKKSWDFKDMPTKHFTSNERFYRGWSHKPNKASDGWAHEPSRDFDRLILTTK